MVTPLRDGMNLIAKEYVATKQQGSGVLILSETAGAAKELGESILVNPNNHGEVVAALESALAMTTDEQTERNLAMQKRLLRYNVTRWAEEFVGRLRVVKKTRRGMHVRLLSRAARRALLRAYAKAERRLLFLDYDGTLVPFFGKPENAKPDAALLRLLTALASHPKNELVILSGRDRHTLDSWFARIGIVCVAEHGALIKEKHWVPMEHLSNEWKREIRPILELYVDRTPGSFTEEKEYSFVWHYRKADPELGVLRARELVTNLTSLTTNLDLRVVEGNKIIEVKCVGVNKGRAALRWLTRGDWDFIFAAGDDWTDEDVFAVLPKNAYSVKVGLHPSRARYNLRSPAEVLILLNELLRADEQGGENDKKP
jgi:trehalose 6-phosphate synthase/phosphatase